MAIITEVIPVTLPATGLERNKAYVRQKPIITPVIGVGQNWNSHAMRYGWPKNSNVLSRRPEGIAKAVLPSREWEYGLIPWVRRNQVDATKTSCSHLS